MKIALAAAFAGAALVVSPAHAAALVQYDFTGAPGSQVSTAATGVAANVTGLSFGRGAGLNAPGAGDSISSSGWNGQATDYFTFGLSIASGFTATVDQLLIGTRSSGTGPGYINLLASLDGGAFSIVKSFTQRGTDFLYQSISFDGLTATNSIEFRLVAATTTSANGGTIQNGGTFRVTNYENGASTSPVSINGSVAAVSAAVPEPATWALMIAGFGVVGAAMRRRPTVRVSLI